MWRMRTLASGRIPKLCWSFWGKEHGECIIQKEKNEWLIDVHLKLTGNASRGVCYSPPSMLPGLNRLKQRRLSSVCHEITLASTPVRFFIYARLMTLNSASGARRSSVILNITAPLGRRSTISYLYARVDAQNDLPAWRTPPSVGLQPRVGLSQAGSHCFFWSAGWKFRIWRTRQSSLARDHRGWSLIVPIVWLLRTAHTATMLQRSRPGRHLMCWSVERQTVADKVLSSQVKWLPREGKLRHPYTDTKTQQCPRCCCI